MILIVLIVGAFPLGFARPYVEAALGKSLHTEVTIASIHRRQWFSLSPDVDLHDVRARQPDWAGTGDMLRIGSLRMHIPLWPVLVGRGISPSAIEARGVRLALVQDMTGRSNWGSDGDKGNRSGGRGLTSLSVSDARFSLRDARRSLALAGAIVADGSGVHIKSAGQFQRSPAQLRFDGPAIDGRTLDDPYSFRFSLVSPELDLRATGTMEGALNVKAMTLDIAAKAPNLKNLDAIILAGLFGTQDIDLKAKVRHAGSDWFIQEIGGTIGRSTMTGRADIVKQGGRSKIEASVDFAALDFNDLADDAGLAKQAALTRRIGPRVIPNTRINIAKVGPTDGVVHFKARKLLSDGDSVFKTLAGDVRLDGKHLRLENVVADLAGGRMTGSLDVRQTGKTPAMRLALRIEEGSLGRLLGSAEKVDAPYGARIDLTGTGDTIREALTNAHGRIGFAAHDGTISRVAAAVLGQDLGKTVGAALGDGAQTVPLKCAAVRFDAKEGILTAGDFAIETGISLSHGSGTIDLHNEAVALAIGGIARESSGLALVDPVTITGTLSSPTLRFAGMDGGKTTVGSAIEAVAKSLGAALGLAKKEGPRVTARDGVGCIALSRAVLE